jgi:hypothetical protein
MTEKEWLKCTEPQKMLEFLRGKASDRKLRLFAVACCRRIWPLLPYENRKAVEVVERFVDGQASAKELVATGGWFGWVTQTTTLAVDSASFTSRAVASEAALAAGRSVKHDDVAAAYTTAWAAAEATARISQAEFLRDIFGPLPFRDVALGRAFPTWQDATVVRLAQAAYEERQMPEGVLDKGRLAVLADALEEAGCTDADILNHLRCPGPHVRCCWPVDLCLGKS